MSGAVIIIITDPKREGDAETEQHEVKFVGPAPKETESIKAAIDAALSKE